MCHSDGSGSQPPDSPNNGARVISLCNHRKRKQIAEATERLMTHLRHIHHRAVNVHNAVIERAELSVLSEFCRTAGLFLDRVDDELRASVLIPAALYGDSSGKIFGKKPLQQRILDDIDEPEAAEILDQINSSPAAVWDCEIDTDVPVDYASPLGGPNRGESREIAGIVCRCGLVEEDSGVYAGWRIEFRDHDFIVFANRLGQSRQTAVRQLLEECDDRNSPELWKRIQLPLVRTIVDPEQSHQWPGHGGLEQREGIRQPVSRNGLLLRIRRAVWRHFADPDEGLTLHAHIAALADDTEAFEALVDEIRQIAESVTMKSGGLREGTNPLCIDEILRPFHTDVKGRLFCRGRLETHPTAVLLLADVIFEATGLSPDRPITEALQWARHHADTAPARTIELAWMTYQTEQNLVATYGRCLGNCDSAESLSDDSQPNFAQRSAVLPNLRTLFDPRFMKHRFADLDLPGERRARLLERGLKLDEQTLADLDRDERELTRRWGVDGETTNAVRHALLQLATQWRWKRCGLDAVDFETPRPDPFEESGGPVQGGE